VCLARHEASTHMRSGRCRTQLPIDRHPAWVAISLGLADVSLVRDSQVPSVPTGHLKNTTCTTVTVMHCAKSMNPIGKLVDERPHDTTRIWVPTRHGTALGTKGKGKGQRAKGSAPQANTRHHHGFTAQQPNHTSQRNIESNTLPSNKVSATRPHRTQPTPTLQQTPSANNRQ